MFANVNDVLTLSSIKGAFTLARFRGRFCTMLARLVMKLQNVQLYIGVIYVKGK
jgi:hypothetical protein